MRDQEKDQLRSVILQLLAKGIPYRFTNLEKCTVSSCMAFATSNTFRRQLYGYLLANGYVERTSRGVYRITDRGRKLLAVLS